MALLNQALKWQEHIGGLPKGSQYDLFRGGVPQAMMEEEKFPTRNHKVIKFGDKSHCESAAFTPDGQFLVSGSSDGYIEVWDCDSGKLCKDLKYQADDELMMHDASVGCLAFSRDSSILASGCVDGSIKIWRIRTGSCVRRFEGAHTAPVTCLEFSRDGTQLLSGSNDTTARIHGLKGGRTLKEFRGHSSFISGATYSQDGDYVITCSHDGYVKVWDVKTTDCIKTFKPSSSQNDIPLNGLSLMPRQSERMLIGNRAPAVYLSTLAGVPVTTYSVPNDINVACFSVSPKANFVYAIGEDQVLYVFSAESGRVEHVVKIHKKDVIGVTHHPHRNVFVSWSQDGTLKIWRP
jgi:WD40 repeat-containing protein SMU1